MTALALQLVRGESTAVNPLALLLPFVLITLPVLALTATAAVLFDTIPVLRAGLGNIAWFFLWMIFAIAGQGVPLGGLGTVAPSMREAIAAQHPQPAAADFSVGFTNVDNPLHTFAWDGLEPSGGFVGARLVLVLAAVCMAALPAVWFGRFDPARARPRRAPAPGNGQTPVLVPATAAPVGRAARPVASRRLAPAKARPGLAAGRLLAGEVRILVQGTSRWWWLVAAGLTAASLAIPANLGVGATVALLSAAWIWPVLIWSRLGTQRRENGLETLLGAYPAVYRQLAAECAAGLALTALTGVGPLVRMAVAGDSAGVAAWIAGALFIPSLALMLGVASRTHRVFQVVYLALWYAAVNQVPATDYMGIVLVDGYRAGPSPSLIAGVSLALLAIAITIRAARHATR